MISNLPSGIYQAKLVYPCASVDPTRVIHPDIHGAAFDPAGRIYITNDGGFYRATVSGSGKNSLDYRWENLNDGLSTLQFYFFDAHPTNPNIILGGLQDNSNAYFNGSFWDGWGFGDGTFGIFDPIDSRHVYMGTQRSVHRHDNGGAKVAMDSNGNPTNGWKLSIYSTNVVTGGERVGFLPTFALDPVQPQIVYGGANATAEDGRKLDGLYRSNDRGDHWSRVNPPASFRTDGWPTTISVSPANHNLVWVGTSTGKVYLFDFDAGKVTQLSTGLPNRYVTKIEAARGNAEIVFVTYSGYNANTPASPGKVFKSTNRGQSWINISGNLPDVPVSALALDPANLNRIWVGSDVGVFMTEDGGATWNSFRLNMPVVASMDLKYNATTGYLMASTHGRGMWRMGINVRPTSPVYLPLLARNVSGQVLPTATPIINIPTATPTRTPSPTATPTTAPSSGINGVVRFKGVPASGVKLRLYLCDFNGCTWTNQQATTGSDGRYSFVGADSLGAGESYQVWFTNGPAGGNSEDPNRLTYWRSFKIPSYTTGSNAPGGNFDIANVSLLSPLNDASVTLPATFTWIGRGVANDHYAWSLTDKSDIEICPLVSTPDTATNFSLTETEAVVCGLDYDTPYHWSVYVTDGSSFSDGYGLSYYYRTVTFASTAVLEDQ